MAFKFNIMPLPFISSSFLTVLQFPSVYSSLILFFRSFPSQSSFWAELQYFCDVLNLPLSRQGGEVLFRSRTQSQHPLCRVPHWSSLCNSSRPACVGAVCSTAPPPRTISVNRYKARVLYPMLGLMFCVHLHIRLLFVHTATELPDVAVEG